MFPETALLGIRTGNLTPRLPLFRCQAGSPPFIGLPVRETADSYEAVVWLLQNGFELGTNIPKIALLKNEKSDLKDRALREGKHLKAVSHTLRMTRPTVLMPLSRVSESESLTAMTTLKVLAPAKSLIGRGSDGAKIIL